MRQIECFGVFQGGGTKAAAFAGAYRAVYEAGVKFHAVAGTSAGAIVAALIGAGAQPDFLEQALRNLDFKALLRPPQPEGRFSDNWSYLVGKLLAVPGSISTKFRYAGKILRFGGIYSSEGIEEWVENKLQELLEQTVSRGTIYFRDLLLPTNIVASDLVSGTARVMSIDRTPDTSVALAVRESCSIPIFFQPVIEGQNRLVDGGIVSNLPAFVFTELGLKRTWRVLAFQLSPERKPQSAWTIGSMAKKLVDTVVSGTADVQLKLQSDVNTIAINTGDVSAVDFDQMNAPMREELVKNGRLAAQKFIADGGISRLQEHHHGDLMDEDEAYLEIVRQSDELPGEVIISERDTKWYWQIFPSVFYWRMRGVVVKVLLLPISGDLREKKKETWRRGNLAGIGAVVKEVDHIPMRAFVFNRHGDNSGSALVLATGEANHGPAATLYHGPRHQDVICLVRERLESAFPPNGSICVDFVPKLDTFTEDKLCKYLKVGVPQYSNANVGVSVEAVPIAGVKLITKFVRAYKYEQVLHLVGDMQNRGIEMFSPCCVTLTDELVSLMAPPVFELHGDTYIGVEGNTRTYYAYRHGLKSIKAVVVRGVEAPLPGTGVYMNEVSLCVGELRTNLRMPGFNYEHFRRIEGACHEDLIHLQDT